MELINITDIQVAKDERIRKYFDEGRILDLADDIAKVGLLHAIVLQQDTNKIIAGERRLRALTMLHGGSRTVEYAGEVLPKGQVPVTRVSSRDAAALLETELVENLAREDLSWQENSAALAKLHALRTSQNPKQTLQATASEVKGAPAEGSDVTKVSDAVTLAEFLDDVDVAKAKTQKEAMKIVRAKAQKKRNEELAQSFSMKEGSQHVLLHGDVRTVLPTIESGQIDVIVTDPPYGVGADSFGDQQFLNHEYDDSKDTWRELSVLLAKESYRICKPEAHAYVFCDIRFWPQLTALFELAGWDVWATPLIWDKGNMGLLPRPEHGPRRCYEAILYAIKGKKKVNAVYHDVIRIPTTGKERHAAEKPVELYEELLKRSVKPGDNILDCFAGSGPIFPAANRLNCRALGIEREEANVGICSTRLEEK